MPDEEVEFCRRKMPARRDPAERELRKNQRGDDPVEKLRQCSSRRPAVLYLQLEYPAQKENEEPGSSSAGFAMVLLTDIMLELRHERSNRVQLPSVARRWRSRKCAKIGHLDIHRPSVHGILGSSKVWLSRTSVRRSLRYSRVAATSPGLARHSYRGNYGACRASAAYS